MDAEKVAEPVRRHARLLAVLGVVAVAAVLLVVAFLEGDFGEDVGELPRLVMGLIKRFGAPASLALLYIEESGIPLPVPGDVYVVYLGSLARGSLLELVAAWLGVILAVTAGASNLYLLSRRWGHRLLTSRFGTLLHIEPERVETVEHWFNRWGAVVVIFGRHIPGFRIPITVMAGIFEVPYRVFAPSVMVSTGIWAGIWIYLGARYGPSVGHLLGRNRWLYFVAVAVIVLVVAAVLVRAWRLSRSVDGVKDPEPEADEQDYEAREERVAQGPRPQDVGGTENTPPSDERDHPGDAPGG